MPALQRFVDVEGLSQEEVMNELFFWLGFWHDRDVLAYYGDPKWNVRMQEVEGESDFTVTSEFERLSRDEAAATGASRRCVITVETSPDFSLSRMQGGGACPRPAVQLFLPPASEQPRPARRRDPPYCPG